MKLYTYTAAELDSMARGEWHDLPDIDVCRQAAAQARVIEKMKALYSGRTTDVGIVRRSIERLLAEEGLEP